MELHNLQKARSFESLGLTTLKSVSGVVSEASPKASSNATPLKARAKASVVAALVVFLTCLACLVAANAQPAKTAWAEGGEGVVVPDEPELPNTPIAPQPGIPTNTAKPAKQMPHAIPNTGDPLCA